MNKLINSVRVNKLFVKILLSFLSFLFPLLLLGTLTYTNFVSDRKEEYVQKLNLDMLSSTQNVGDYWRRVYETSRIIFSDPVVIRLMKPKQDWSLQERADLNILQGSLSRAKFNINSFVDGFFIYVDEHYVFTDSGINEYDYFFNKFYHYDSYDPEFWSDQLKTVHYMKVMYPATVDTSFESKEVITFLAASQIGENKPVLGITVTVDKIWELFDPILKPGISRIIVLDKDGRMVMSSDRDFPNESALRGIESVSFIDESKNPEIQIDGETFIINRIYNDVVGWYFYALTPAEEFNRQASGIFNFIVTLCFVLGFVSLILALLFSYRIYTPIRRLGEVLENTATEVDEGSNAEARYSYDLQHIGDGIKRILSHQSQFHGQMETLAQEYVDYVLFQLMKGHTLSEDQTENVQRILRTRFGFQKEGFLCCAINLKFKDRFWTDIQDVDRILIESKLKNLFYDLLKERANLYVLETGKSQYVLIFNVSLEGTSEEVKIGLEELAGVFSSDMQFCQVHIAIGDICEGVDGIAKSYRNSMAALYQITGNPDFEIVEFTGKSSCQEPIIYTYSDENKLLQLLRFGNREDAVQWVEDMLRSNKDALYSLDILYMKLFETARRFLVERGIDAEELLGVEERSYLLQREQMPSREDKREEVLLNFIFRVMDRVRLEHSSPRSAELASTIKKYVENNYMTDLHLEKISEEMGVTVKYISRLFKESFNMNITRFISELRVNKAKELLETTDLPVTAIATQVGIFDRTTFLRTFKKLEGVSPNDYRREIRNRKEENHD